MTHIEFASAISSIEAQVKELHAKLRESHRPGSRTRLEASKALAAVRALRLSLVEQMQAETIDRAREEYFR